MDLLERPEVRGLLAVYLLGGMVKVSLFFTVAIFWGVRVWEMAGLTVLAATHGILVPTALPPAFGLAGYGGTAIALLWRRWDISAEIARRRA